MKKGIGPRGLGAPKSTAKMYGDSPAKQTSWDDQKDKNSYNRSRKKDNERIARNTAREEMEAYRTNPETRRAARSMSSEQERRISNSIEQRVISELNTKQMERAKKAKK